MREVNLLIDYPRIKRPIASIARSTEENQKISKLFGKEYFDGDRKYGYGGYKYDGRWAPIAKRFASFYGLNKDSWVLDIGCAKGYFLHDLREVVPGIKVTGVDISQYAIDNTIEDIKPYAKVGDARKLPFSDKSFDLVVSINVIHNFDLIGCAKAIYEMERVSRKHKYLQMDSWENEEQHKNLLNWKLTAETFMDMPQWRSFLKDIEYTGDYYFTLTT